MTNDQEQLDELTALARRIVQEDATIKVEGVPWPDEILKAIAQAEERLRILRLLLAFSRGLREESSAEGALFASLPFHARQALRELGIRSPEHLAEVTADDLLVCRNVGKSTVNKIREWLRARGLHLRHEV